MEKHFRQIVIALHKTLTVKEKSIVKDFFALFAGSGISYSIAGKEFTLLLHSLDVKLFNTALEDFKKNAQSPQLTFLFEQIAADVNQIGSYGIKGKKRIFTGFDVERKVKARKTKEQDRNQYYYAREHGFCEFNHPFPVEYENRIIRGDSLEVLKGLPENCVDLVFTSPPYNFGLEYTTGHDAHHWEHYFQKLFSIFDECIRVLKYGGRIVVNIQPLFSDYIPSHHIISHYFMDKKLIWKGEILWEKNNYNCKYTAWGSWKSPSNPYLKYTWEFLEIFAKGVMKKSGDKQDADITADEFKKWVVSKWSIAPERKMKVYDHPAMFPVELALRVLKLFSFKRDLILDPFNGAGTTTYAAHITGRKYLGIDISDAYCRQARKRILPADASLKPEKEPETS